MGKGPEWIKDEGRAAARVRSWEAVAFGAAGGDGRERPVFGANALERPRRRHVIRRHRAAVLPRGFSPPGLRAAHGEGREGGRRVSPLSFGHVGSGLTADQAEP